MISKLASALRICVMVATGTLATSALAQPVPIETLDQTEFIENINETSVEPALSVVTGNHLLGTDPQGNPKLIGTATNGLRFEVNFRACENGADGEERHCKAIYMMSIWDAPQLEDQQAFTAAMDAFSRDNPAVNAGRLSDGSPYIVRYVIADFGTNQGNLVSEFANFIRSATDYQNAIAGFYQIEE